MTTRPITIAILAMGGEGGGVLSDWLADVGRRHGWTSQTTSVAGVAQRTGATIYYAELFPPGGEGATRGEPVLSTMPTPGEVDVVIASELMEAGRAVQRGLVTPDRTTLIASTNRVYSILEKSGTGDARVDSAKLMEGAEAAAKKLVSADFMKLAVDARSVISASLFGAVAGADVLPFPRATFEQAIRDAGKGVEQSLAAFQAGFEVAQGAAAAKQAEGKTFLTLGRRPKSDEEVRAEADAVPHATAQTTPRALVGPALAAQADRVGATIPPGAKLMTLRGLERVAIYQDIPYAERYLARVEQMVQFEKDPEKATLTAEVARYTALWMCYQDTIHVALQKVRSQRIKGVRTEARAKNSHPVEVREFLHPQVDEVTDSLPAALGARLRRSKLFRRLVDRIAGDGIVINTTSVFGYSVLATLARLRPTRPRSLRFQHEQREIDAWLSHVVEAAREDYELGVEVARLPRVLKGYGETWERGETKFAALTSDARRLQGRPGAAPQLAKAMQEALA